MPFNLHEFLAMHTITSQLNGPSGPSMPYNSCMSCNPPVALTSWATAAGHSTVAVGSSRRRSMHADCDDTLCTTNWRFGFLKPPNLQDVAVATLETALPGRICVATKPESGRPGPSWTFGGHSTEARSIPPVRSAPASG